MVQKLTIELPEDLYESARQAAEKANLPLEDWFVRQVGFAAPTTEMRRRSLQRLVKYAGAATPESASNSHNEQIDRDLAEEYVDTHEESR